MSGRDLAHALLADRWQRMHEVGLLSFDGEGRLISHPWTPEMGIDPPAFPEYHQRHVDACRERSHEEAAA